MVGATFSYFHWSTCSSGEYHFKSNGWKCTFNYPYTLKNATFIGNVIEYTYSLDDQCRMEFGEGFKFCTSFQVRFIFLTFWVNFWILLQWAIDIDSWVSWFAASLHSPISRQPSCPVAPIIVKKSATAIFQDCIHFRLLHDFDHKSFQSSHDWSPFCLQNRRYFDALHT